MSPRKPEADDWELHVKERALVRQRWRLAVFAGRVATDHPRHAA